MANCFNLEKRISFFNQKAEKCYFSGKNIAAIEHTLRGFNEIQFIDDAIDSNNLTVCGDPFFDNGFTIGKYSEWRVYYAIKCLFKNKSWFSDVRLATQEEDELGIDVLLYTKQNIIPIQVKSSKKAFNRHNRKYRDIIALLINRDFSPQQVKNAILFHLLPQISL